VELVKLTFLFTEEALPLPTDRHPVYEMIRWREERQRREEGNLAEERWIEILFLEF
jgi:hypothetical protein